MVLNKFPPCPFIAELSLVEKPVTCSLDYLDFHYCLGRPILCHLLLACKIENVKPLCLILVCLKDFAFAQAVVGKYWKYVLTFYKRSLDNNRFHTAITIGEIHSI